MPELPEVEVTKKALESALKKTSITGVNIRNKKLRWPVEEKRFATSFILISRKYTEEENTS
jgi:Formamidopyrimidine-DNA glycosylase